MNIKNSEVKKIIDKLNIEDTLKLSDAPDLDLYMDQVITLFDNKLSNNKRFEEDKLLTKTMINNYAKDNLILPIKNKKYSKENVLLLSLIYTLKQSLSIADIKMILTPIIESHLDENIDSNILDLYSKYLSITTEDAKSFKSEIENTFGSDDERDILLVMLSLINKANMYKRLSEKLIDEFLKKDLK